MCPQNKWSNTSQWSEELIANLAGEKHALKLEEVVEDLPLPKRQKPSSSSSVTTNKFILDPNKPGPFGLTLDITPEFLNLIQMRLSQAHNNAGSFPSENLQVGKKKDVKARIGTSDPIDKLKASNFPVLLLRIGEWEYVTQREGDLVAKCYFAKHRIAWEVLDGALKNKIEIQWEDIIGLKANFPENGPSNLTITLVKGPLFFKETNPQPRKHTIWQATSDFTNGEASRVRKHYIECAEGVLNKHYEKLIHCDTRLNFVSQQFDTSLEFTIAEASIEAPNISHNTLSNRHEMTKVPSVDIMGLVFPSTLQCLLKDVHSAHKDTNGNDYSNPESMVLSSKFQCLLKDVNSTQKDTGSDWQDGNDYSTPHCNQRSDDYWMKQEWEKEDLGISRNNSLYDLMSQFPPIESLDDVFNI